MSALCTCSRISAVRMERSMERCVYWRIRRPGGPTAGRIVGARRRARAAGRLGIASCLRLVLFRATYPHPRVNSRSRALATYLPKPQNLPSGRRPTYLPPGSRTCAGLDPRRLHRQVSGTDFWRLHRRLQVPGRRKWGRFRAKFSPAGRYSELSGSRAQRAGVFSGSYILRVDQETVTCNF